MAKAAAKAAIASFYGHARPALSDCIQAGLAAYGATPASATLQHLELFDSFHIGGSDSARHLFHNLLGEPSSEQARVIDVGCGLGGPARLLASEWPGCSVTGVDITPEFVEVGNELSAWEGVALSDRVTLVTAAADHVFLADESADAAYMIHVGMNIADKVSLANEVHRVLAPGGVFGIYDLMAGDEDGVSMLMPMGEGALRFPLPFADSTSTAFVDSPALYREVFEKAGFEQVHHVDRTDYALKVLRAWKGKFGAAAPASSPLAFDELNQPLPPLGLHLVMGPTFREKMTNSLDALEGGRLEAHEMIFKKADA